jgi:hypothetical protein
MSMMRSTIYSLVEALSEREPHLWPPSLHKEKPQVDCSNSEIKEGEVLRQDWPRFVDSSFE